MSNYNQQRQMNGISQNLPIKLSNTATTQFKKYLKLNTILKLNNKICNVKTK